MTQRATFSLAVAIEQGISTDLGSKKDSISLEVLLDLLNGTGAEQANATFSDERQIAASGDEDLDLSGGLTDAFGNSIAFTGIKAMLIVADENNGDDLVIGGASSAGFTSWVGGADDTIILPPGGFMLLGRKDAAGWLVTATTADLLTIANADSVDPATYKIVLVGITA